MNSAIEEWARFDFPVWDISRSDIFLFPQAFVGGELVYRTVSPDINEYISSPSIVPRLLRQGAKEHDRSVADRIGEYWAVVPGREYTRSIQNSIWSEFGPTGYAVPWSAAFVSWVMCKAGLEFDNFKRRQAHSGYIADIIANGNNTLRAFEAYDLQDVDDLAPGDLICADRQSSAQPYISGIDDERIVGRATHCDIVVRVEFGRVFAVGGNVIDGVTLTMIPLNEGGTLRQSVQRNSSSPSAIRHCFVVLRLKDNSNRDEEPGMAMAFSMQQDIVRERIHFLSGQ